jgi:hypothetical protein
VDFAEHRGQAERAFAELVGRAKASGDLRSDFGRADLTLILAANGGLKYRRTEDRVAASRRLVRYLLHGMSATR